MEKFQFLKDTDDNHLYSPARGRYFKLFLDDDQQTLLQIGETDDYFYFTIMLKENYLKNSHSLIISPTSVLYSPLCDLLSDFKEIEVMEEGSPERKSISFKKEPNQIEIKFTLTDQEKVFYTIELANLRRLGDTKFKTLSPQRQLTNEEQYKLESSFKYKFKARIHNLLDRLEESTCENFPS